MEIKTILIVALLGLCSCSDRMEKCEPLPWPKIEVGKPVVHIITEEGEITVSAKEAEMDPDMDTILLEGNAKVAGYAKKRFFATCAALTVKDSGGQIECKNDVKAVFKVSENYLPDE